MRRCRVVDGPISSLGWLRVAVLRPCNHPAQSYVSGVLPASEKSTTDNAIDREESRTPTYNNNNNKNDYNTSVQYKKWDTGAFPVPRDTLRLSF